MGFLVLNNARTTLSGSVSIGNTSLPVADGSGFAVGSDYSYITLENNAGQIETVKLTSRSGGTLTIASPGVVYNWASGTIVECRPCSQAVAAIVEDTIHDASAETTIADGDESAIVDISASNVLKKITWANVKATLKTYLDTLYQSLTGDVTLAAGKAVIFEGATDDAYETTLTVADPTADRTITLPDYTGTAQVQARGADIASSGTINLSTATGDIVDVTGTTTITAITLADGLEKQVRFTGALTLTNGASLVLPGAANIITAAGDIATFRGYAAGVVRCVDYQKADGTAVVADNVQGARKNLKIVASGLTNTSVVVTASHVMTFDNTAYKVARSVNVTVDSAASGANGLDTGAVAASTWYAVYIIMKPDGTTAGLLSLASSGPTMPSGYTYKARVGWVRTDGTANKYLLQTVQTDNRAAYKVLASSNVPNLPQMASGVLGTYPGTYAAIATGDFVPTTASRIAVLLQSLVNSAAGVAPNNDYGALNSATNLPPLFFSTYPNGGMDLTLEASDLYAVSSNTVYVKCYGWEDNL